MLQPQREALAVYCRSRWDFSRFSILFRLFEALIFTPGWSNGSDFPLDRNVSLQME
jgi:hypothetical protein